MMYNSLCVLTHPQWPWGSPQCITVNTELHRAVARSIFCFINPHTLKNSIYKITKEYAHLKPILRYPFVHHSHYRQILVHQHAPLHPHKTAAIPQINIKAWLWMGLAVTGTLSYERDPIDPCCIIPSSSKGHHSVTIDLLHVCVCVSVWKKD